MEVLGALVDPLLSVTVTAMAKVLELADPVEVYWCVSLWGAPVRVSTVPSPQSTFVELMVPSGSEEVIDTVTVWPVETDAGEDVKVMTGGRSETVTCDEYFPVEPLLSVALTVMVKLLDANVPVELYLWVSLVAVPDRESMVPSPQSTFIDVTVPSGSEADIVRVTFWPVLRAVDDGLKLGLGTLS